ncbi:polyprenol phosphomannose-dependent alpha 1,6 mannosyltransferase MptB [Actinoplanes sp. RD1]|uniref:polyprenol phosphomannose-dependent alpha 1,6 mannosyltransferase MptB n=1 Tax=Actinoplanes sp. RD1 TaxID=3064538 RepID=UPI002740D9CC|nr:polyprenol phosphomannose-dependent alpha 1,6 mannosyltransferase MptB [Actinoplanes sp. RD1]
MTDFLRSPAGVRWLGFAGAVCCAADAVLFGAPTWIRRGVSVVSILRGPHGVLIMALWILGLAALCTAWWLGRRLDVSRGWILVTAALWVLPLLFVPPLASRDMYAYACQGALVDAGFNPSVDPIAAQPCPWIESVSVVWRTTPTPYGPLWILLSGLAASFGSQAVALGIFRAYEVVALIALALALPPLARRVGVDERRALWLVLCCPLVMVHFIGGGHNDTLAMALLVAGLALIAGRRPAGLLIAGGALLGAAILVKSTIGVVLPFAALLASGGLRDFAAFVRRGGAVVLGAVLLIGALSLGSGLGFGWATSLSGAGESRSWTSPPTAVGIAVNAAGKLVGADIDVVPAARAVALVLLLVALVVIWWRHRDADPLGGAGLALLAVIFLAPITQPWYLYWPLVLWAVAAAGTRWLAAAVIVVMFLILPNGDGAWKPLQVPLAFAVTGLVVWVAWRSVRWLRVPVT